MKSSLKKVAILFAVLTIGFTAAAQTRGTFAVGINGVYGTGDSHSNFGLGAKAQYNLTDPLRVEGSFTYFFENDNITMWDISVNAHWLFPLGDRVFVYPLVGISLLNANPKGFNNDSETDFGANLGVGFEGKLTEDLNINVEGKYRFANDWDRMLISAGFTYLF